MNAKIDELVQSHPLGRLCKKAKVKARESRGARRTDSTPQRQRDEAQRRDWPSCEVVKIETPRVSVIIPTFDRGWCLREAVDSALAQEFTNFELIVVDDGSADGTAELLEAYRPKVRLLRQANRGVSAARNRGIAAARGELIAFLDSDDLWLPQKLSTQVEFFRAHPHALIAQTEEIWVRNGRRVNPGKRHRKRSGMIFESSLDLCLVSPSAVMVRRELFDRAGLFDERPAGLRGLRPVAAGELWHPDLSHRHPPHRQTRRPRRPALPRLGAGPIPNCLTP